MTGSADGRPFYVSVLAAVDEDDLIADIVFAGRQVADVRIVAGKGVVTLYNSAGAEGSGMPLDGFRAALDEAVDRLQSG
jgi:hypothetical protein